YVSHDKIVNRDVIRKNYKTFQAFADMYCYFIELAIELQNEKGILCFITSNSYLRADYGEPLRKFIYSNNYIKQIVNIEDSQLFEAAIVNTVVLISQNQYEKPAVKSTVVNAEYNNYSSFYSFVKQNAIYYEKDDFSQKVWSLIPKEHLTLKNKISSLSYVKTLEELNTKIRLGIATGANNAFVISEEQKNDLLKEDKRNEDIIKPILRGRDIFRYHYNFSNHYVLLTKNGIDVKKDYPSIYNYLDKFGEKFKKRGAKGRHWTNLRACAFFDDFKEEQIAWIELTDKGRFALLTEEIYLLNSAYFLLPPKGFKSKYLLGVLNSKVIGFYLDCIAGTSGMGTKRWINTYMEQLPVSKASDSIQKKVIEEVDCILSLSSESSDLEKVTIQNKIK
ncbi:Eco57I restriction-modification methylase domain-containing protein, partial [Priestia megaterium]|uniref:Eco57I restriction-modification methylase domain-containing protein n=1 Tax=Priestia megaterium TaxID=1404 RepID=UPI002FFDD1C3